MFPAATPFAGMRPCCTSRPTIAPRMRRWPGCIKRWATSSSPSTTPATPRKTRDPPMSSLDAYRPRRRDWALVVGLALWAGGCSRSPSESTTAAVGAPSTGAPRGAAIPVVGSVRFSEVAQTSGVSWIGRNGEEAELFTILETFGTGCAVDDYDRDGRLDLFFA